MHNYCIQYAYFASYDGETLIELLGLALDLDLDLAGVLALVDLAG